MKSFTKKKTYESRRFTKEELFSGKIDYLTLSGNAKKALCSYIAQKQRCYYTKSVGYKHYGAQGIRMEYTSREFITWYLKEIGTRSFKSPTVGRIDHAKNYTLDNICIEERADNCRERNTRLGNPGSKKIVRLYWNNPRILIGDISSVRLVSALTKVNRTRIQRLLNKKISAPMSWYYFEWGG